MGGQGKLESPEALAPDLRRDAESPDGLKNGANFRGRRNAQSSICVHDGEAMECCKPRF